MFQTAFHTEYPPNKLRALFSELAEGSQTSMGKGIMWFTVGETEEGPRNQYFDKLLR